LKTLRQSAAKADRRNVRHELNKLIGLPVKFAPDVESPVPIVNRKISADSLATRSG